MITATSNTSSSNRPVAVPAAPPTLPRTTTTNVISGSVGDASSSQSAGDAAMAPTTARSLSISGTSVGGSFGLDSLTLEAGAVGGATPSSSTLPSGSTGIRTTRFMMEGVGARVIRGPDWKWGKQVCNRMFFTWSIYFIYNFKIMLFVRVAFDVTKPTSIYFILGRWRGPFRDS